MESEKDFLQSFDHTSETNVLIGTGAFSKVFLVQGTNAVVIKVTVLKEKLERI